MERSTNFASAGLKNCFKTFFDTSIQLSHDVSLTARTRTEVCKWTVRENFKHWRLSMTIWQLVVMVRKKCKQAVGTGIAVCKLYYDVIRSETLYLTTKLVPYLKQYIIIIFFRGHGNESCKLIGSLPGQYFPISAHGNAFVSRRVHLNFRCHFS